jgi:orotidine-5'-phosphate decarboxylase
MVNSPIILALDSSDIGKCASHILATKNYVSVYKIGLEFFNKNGLSGIEKLRAEVGEFELFLDLKLHDIPNTVAGACRALHELSPKFLTVHASGGSSMVSAAATELPNTAIAAVTVLTSLNQESLETMGMPKVEEFTLALARNAVAAGARALVASPHEVRVLRREFASSIQLITPGVRPISLGDDQERTATPKVALLSGADFLVIGRPITGAENPGAAAAEIFASLN